MNIKPIVVALKREHISDYCYQEFNSHPRMVFGVTRPEQIRGMWFDEDSDVLMVKPRIMNEKETEIFNRMYELVSQRMPKDKIVKIWRL